MSEGDLRLELSEDDLHDELLSIEGRLYEFNVEATGIRDGRLLRVVLRDGAGRLVAAAMGHTWGGTCEIVQLWVEAARRRGGLGRKLMARAEAEARARGCRQIVLTTHSFQAPDFYRRLGFVPLGEIPDYPAGHSKITLRKPLGDGG